MPLFTSSTALRIVDAIAIVLSQALQLARARVSSAASPMLRMMVERDHAVGETDLLRRELDILRSQRASTPAHKRREYDPVQRLAILQVMRLRGWSVPVAADHFVVHPNTLRSWIAAVLDGCTRRLLRLKVYGRTPTTCHVLALVRSAAAEFGAPRFLITDHGPQFRRRFKAAMSKRGIRHVRGRARAPFLNGKCERLFKTFRGWWRLVLSPITVSGIQARQDSFRAWHDGHRPHSAIGGLTPIEAWEQTALPEPIPIRTRDQLDPQIDVRRWRCRGDPRLPIIDISVRLRRAA